MVHFFWSDDSIYSRHLFHYPLPTTHYPLPLECLAKPSRSFVLMFFARTWGPLRFWRSIIARPRQAADRGGDCERIPGACRPGVLTGNIANDNLNSRRSLPFYRFNNRCGMSVHETSPLENVHQFVGEQLRSSPSADISPEEAPVLW
jgi:hypothetical protein